MKAFSDNAEFFTLTYETPISISHNLAFHRVAPLLWLRAGSRGKRIDSLPAEGWAVADAYGLLTEVDRATPFIKALTNAEGLEIAYIVTDDDRRFQALANQQRTAAKELLWIREQLLLLIMECHMPSVPLIQLQKSLEMVNRELTAVYKFAPSTSPDAYASAEKSLKSGHFTFSDDEIDGFLPTVLRKNQPPTPPSV